jgi:hypothetical protein
MIRTLDELVSFTERYFKASYEEDFPELAEQFVLRTSGCSDSEIQMLREEFPGIPTSYLEIAALVSLPKIQLGYFRPAPGGVYERSLYDRLSEINSPDHHFSQQLHEQHLYCVAGYSGDLICVRRELGEFRGLKSDRSSDETLQPGEVVRILIEPGAPLVVWRVAWTFEQTLVGFGRLKELSLDQQFGRDVVAAFLRAMRADFHLDDEQLSQWDVFAREQIGEDPNSEGGEEDTIGTALAPNSTRQITTTGDRPSLLSRLTRRKNPR